MKLWTQRRCGTCLHFHRSGGDVNGAAVGYCFGAPPTVMNVTTSEQGVQNITTQFPLKGADHFPCGVHTYAFGLRALLWRLTGGPPRP